MKAEFVKSDKLPKNLLKPQSHRFAIEQRIVFDAAVAAAAVDAADHSVDSSTAKAAATETVDATRPIAVSLSAAQPQPQVATVETPAEADAAIKDADPKTGEQHHAAVADRNIIEGSLAPTNLTASEIIFIDATVKDLQSYLIDHPQADVVLLDANRDGLAQIATVLAGRTGINTIHILSHGADGELYLGNTTFDLQTMTGEHAAELAVIKAALTENADILVYGCDVAVGAKGQAFVQALAEVTGADIAASIDSTGNADLGGDWQLESSTGNIEASVLALTDYQDLLAAPTINDSVSIRATAEDVNLSITGVTIADVDGDNQTVTLTTTNGIINLATTSGLTGLAGNGTGLVAFTGTIAQVNAAINGMTFTPTANHSGAASVAVSSNDGTTTANRTINITVNPVSDAPTLSVSPASGNEDTAIALAIVSALTDPSETLAITLSAIPVGSVLTNTAGDTLVISAGSITLTSVQLAGLKILPPADFSGSIALTVTATSTDGIAAPASIANTLTVTVLPVDDAPVAVPDLIAITEDVINVVGNVLDNDTDPDSPYGDTKLVQGVALGMLAGPLTGGYGNPIVGLYGKFTLNSDGTYTYVLNNTNPLVQALAAGQTVADTFTYTVKDSTNLTSTTGITVTITGANDAPVVVSGATSTPPSIPENAIDAENPGVLVSSLLSNVTGILATDVDSGTNLGISVDSDSFTNGMAGHWEIQLNGSSTWTTLTIPATLVYDTKIRFIADLNVDDTKESGIALLNYHAWDGITTSSNGLTADFVVTSHNDVPTLTPVTLVLGETAPAFITAAQLPLVDPDNINQQILYRVESMPVNGELYKNGIGMGVGSLFSQEDVAAGNVISYRYIGGELSANLNDSFTFSVRDGAGGVLGAPGGAVGDTTPRTLNITINDVNAQIAIAGATQSANEKVLAGDYTNLSLGMSDPDGNPALMQLTITTLPDPVVGKLQYWNGLAYVDVTAGLQLTQAQLNANPLRFISTGLEPSLRPNTSFNVSASDNHPTLPPTTTTGTVTVNIVAVNDPPTPVTTTLTIDQGTSGTIGNTSFAGRDATLTATDPDSLEADRVYTISVLPNHGILEMNGVEVGVGFTFIEADLAAGLLTYINDGLSGADDAFSFAVNDRDGGISAGTMSIDIIPGTGTGTPGGGTLSALPVEDGILVLDDLTLKGSTSYTLTTVPVHGTLYLNGTALGVNATFTQADIDASSVVYVSDGSEPTTYGRTDPFTISRTGGSVSGSSTVVLTVSSNNDAPTITQTTGSVALLEANSGGGDASSFALTNVSNAVKLTTANLQSNDSDTPLILLDYVIDAVPTGGTLNRWSGSAWLVLGVGTHFSAQDVVDGNVAYFHDAASELRNDGISVHLVDGGVVQIGDIQITAGVGVFELGSKLVSDGSTAISIVKGDAARSPTRTVSFTITNVNDAPVAYNSSFTVVEGFSNVDNVSTPNNPDRIQVLNSAIIGVTDTDNTNSERIYTIVSIPVKGVLEMDTDGNGSFETTVAAGQTFTYAQLIAGKLRYVHSGGEDLTDSFTFKANDLQPLDSNIATVSINIRPMNDPPVINNNNPITVNEGSLANVITTAFLGTPAPGSLVDPDNTPLQVQYRLSGGVSHGLLYLDNGGVITALGEGSAFTLQDVIDGKLKYTHDGSEPDFNVASVDDSFNFIMSDSSGMNEPAATFSIHVNPVNDAPRLGNMGGTLPYVEDSPATIIDSHVSLNDTDLANNGVNFQNGRLTISFTDVLNHTADQLSIRNQGNGAGQIGYDSGTGYITYGGVQFGDASGGVNGADLVIILDTAANIAAVKALIQNINFQNTDTANPAIGTRTLLFTLNDGGDTANGGSNTTTATAHVSVSRANDAPILAPVAPDLGTITEDDVITGLTTTVAAMVGASISDVDVLPLQGIAITGLNSGNGTWQYSTDGSNWIAVGVVSDASALLLRATDSIRFIPDGKNATSATVTYRAWDQTTGTFGSKVDTTAVHILVPADTAAFSVNHDTATLIVTAVNDAPIGLAPIGLGNLTLASTFEDTLSPAGGAINTLTGLNFQDVDIGATLSGIAVIGNTANSITEGSWQYSSDGINWKAIGTVADGVTALALSATTQLRFVPVANYNGNPPSLSVRAMDDTYVSAFSTTTGGIETRANLDSSANGGTTSISANANTIGTTVTALNDAPAISNSTPVIIAADENTPVPLGAIFTINDIDLARFEGTNTGQITLSVPHGAFTLNTTGVTITAGTQATDRGAGDWGGGTNTLVFTGTLASLQAALNTVNYVPGDDSNTTEVVTVTLNDLNNTGLGSASGGSDVHSVSAIVTINLISLVNDAPTVTAPASVTATEDTVYTFSGGVISIADVDVRPADIVALTLNLSSAGTFSFSTATGLFTDAAATIPYILTNEAAGADVVVYGTLTNLNAALNGMRYTPTSNLNSVNIGPDYIGGAFAGHVHLDITVNDRGYGVGGVPTGLPLTASNMIDITVNPVNDAPGIAGPSTSSGYIEQAAPVTIGAGVTVTDAIDDTQLSGATVTISANARVGDILAATVLGSITASYNAATYVLTLSGADSIANYNTVLQSVTFSNPSNDAPTSGGATTRTITWQATDNNADGAANGVQASNAVSSTVNITPVSDAPTGTDKIIATNEDQVYTFTTADFGFSDPLDNPTDTLNRVLITTLPAGGLLKLNGVDVVAGDYILATDIVAGKLTYVPDANFNSALTTTVNPALAIFDNTTITSTLTISGAAGNISDLNLALNISHTWVGDLGITLTAPDGTVLTLFNRNGGSADNLVLTFDDEAATSVTAIPNSGGVTVPGSYRPFNLLSAFDGKDPNGTWTLTVRDNAGGDIGTLNSWTLIPTTAAPALNFTFQVEDTGNLLNGGVILDQSPNNMTINVIPLNDAPVLTATASNASVIENATTGGPVSVDPVALLNAGANITDLDLSTTAALNSTIFGAGSITVSFTDAYVTGDVLFVNGALPAGVTTAGGLANTLTINLATTTTVAEVDSLLAAISYRSSSDNPTLNDSDTSRAYQIVVNDGNNRQGATTPNAGGPATLNSNVISGILTLTATNDAPLVDLNGVTVGFDNALTWTEGANVPHTAILIAPGATVTDVDNTNMTQLVMQLGGALDGNSEVLNIGGVNFQLGTTVSNVAAGGFLVSYDSGTQLFTILPTPTSIALATSFQTLIRGITYINTTDNPTDGDRTLDFTITDAGYDNSVAVGGELGGNTPIATINVNPVNDQPVITGLDAVSYFENSINATAAMIDGSITLTDIDSVNYDTGTLTVSGLVAGQDTVSLPVGAAAVLDNVQINGGNVEYYDGSSWIVIGTQSGGVGANFIVTFNANATAAIVERVIENLTFANSANNPTLTRTLTLAVNDGDGGTVQNATVGVTIKLDNDAPLMAASSLGGTYTEQNAVALQFVGGVISLSDPDSPADFFTGGAGSLTVALDTYVIGDTLNVLAGGSIGVAGNTISHGGTAFATTSGGNGAPLVITFTSTTATPAAVQALLASLRYSSTSDDPTVNNTDPDRVFTVTLNDGGNTKDVNSSTTALTAQLTGTINLTALNDAPVITPSGTAAYTENAGATAVDNTLTVTDVDDTQITGGTISITGNFLAGDVLAVSNIGSITASYDANSGILTLSGTDTLANYQAVLHSLTYLNSTDDPTDNTTKATRTLTYSLTDANSDAVGAATGTATKTINVTALTDAPLLGGAGNTRSYTEDDAVGITLEPALTLSDADDTQMASATVTLSAGLTAGDVLTAATAGTSIIAIYTPATGVLSLTGTDTTAHYLQVLQSVKYYSTSNDPTATSATRTITWHTNDANSDLAGTGSSNNVTTTINVTPLNDAPTAVDDVNSITENAAPASINGNVMPGTPGQDSDPDSLDVLIISGIRTGTEAAGTGTIGAIGTALVDSYGSLTLNANGSYTYLLDNTNPVVNSLRAGQTLTVAYTYTLNDQNGGTDQAQLTITINGVTDGAPTITPVDGNGAAAGEATVLESGLLTVPDTSETTTGTLTVTTPDGMASITLGGTTFTVAQLATFSVGSPSAGINTGEGTLIVTGFSITAGDSTAPTAGTLSYSYTLNAAQTHSGATAIESIDTIAIAVTDATTAAVTTAGTLSIRIVDDTPTANADVNNVTEGTTTATTTTTGNVFAAGSAGDVADRIGADSTAAPVTGVASGAQVSASGSVNSPVAGTYGSLTLNATGGYTYTLDNTNPAVNALRATETLLETYSYTITDADGDTSTTQLTITINGVTDGAPTITPVDGNGAAAGEATVLESGLLTVPDTSETTTGTLTVTTPDGMASITLGGTTFTVAQLATFSVGSPSAGINTGEGTLIVTGFSITAGDSTAPTAGTLSYSYTLNAAQTHSGATAIESIDTIAIAVTDATTAAVTTAGTLSIRIVDDTPTANADANSVTEGTTTAATTTTGNVFAAGSAGDVSDRIGADSTATPITGISFGATTGSVGSALSGSYGSLTLNADGSYSYAVDNTNPTVNALRATETLLETYSYTITDADGDTSTTTLSITINGVTDGAPTITPVDGNGAAAGEATVLESGLLTVPDTSETTAGTLTVTAPDGMKSVTIGGTTFTVAQLAGFSVGSPSASINTGEGTLIVTGFSITSGNATAPTAGTLSYSYTLNAALTHSGATAIESMDTIAIAVTDATTAAVTTAGTLSIRIVDDTPTANADANSVTEGTTTAATTTTGNVFAAGSAGDVADRIGADSTATPVTAISFGGNAKTVGVLFNSSYGDLTLNSDGSYTYNLDNTNPTVNALLDTETLTETFNYTITDADGDSSPATLIITINGTTDGALSIISVDNNGAAAGQADVFEKGLLAPTDNSQTTTGTLTVTASDGMASVTLGGTTFTVAQLVTFSVGSPSASINTGEGTLIVTGFSITAGPVVAPTAGTLSYSYTLNAALTHAGATAAESTDSIALVVTDATVAANTANGTLTLRIVDDTPTASNDSNSVNEGTTTAATTTGGNVFATGSAGDVADRQGADSNATPITGISFGATTGSIGNALSGSYGSLTLNADGSYSYAVDNTNPTVNALKVGQSLTEIYVYTLTDADGDASTATLTISIIGTNDAPVADDESVTTLEDTPIVIDVLTGDTDVDGDTLSVKSINGVLLTPGTPQTIAVPNGTVAVSATGVITFTPAHNYFGPVTFDYVVQDGNGGEDTGTVNVTVTDVISPPTATAFEAAGSARDKIPVVLTGTDVDGTIASVTVKTLPPATQGVLTLADGTPVVTGVPLTPAQAAGLIFKPNITFNGAATILFIVTDDEGLESTLASATLKITEDSVLFEQLVTRRYEPFVPLWLEGPALVIDMPEILHVADSVRQSQNITAQNSNLGVFNADMPTRAELNNFTFDLKGLPVGMDPALFVQHAVRGLPVAPESNLFVQNAVRQSQTESLIRNIGVTSFNTATAGVISVLSPFEVGAINQGSCDTAAVGAQCEPVDKARADDDTEKSQGDAVLEKEQIVEISAEKMEAPVRITANKQLAAASFANQLKMAAQKRNSRFGL